MIGLSGLRPIAALACVGAFLGGNSHSGRAAHEERRMAPEVVSYMDLDAAEVGRQTELLRSGLQEIAPVMLPESGRVGGDGGFIAQGGLDNFFGWPHAGIIEDVVVVHIRQGAALVRSTDGGQSWEKPVATPERIFVAGTVRRSGRLLLVGVNREGPGGVEVMSSDDKGRSWAHRVVTAVTPRHLTARLIDHPRFGLIAGGHPSSNELVFLVSSDEGTTWRRVSFPVPGFFSDGTVVFQWGDQIGVFARPGHGGPRWVHFAQATTVNAATAARFEDLQWRFSATNIFTGKADTPDAIYNPVSRRIEAVVTKRDAGFPYRDTGLSAANPRGYMTLALWSIAPESFLAGKADWRFEGTMVRSTGEKARLENPRDGMHPSGTVVDEKRGVQHIFIHAGDRAHGDGAPSTGRTGVFRVTRTLDTARWRESISRLDNYSEIDGLREDFNDLSGWRQSGSPTGEISFHRTEPPVRTSETPIPRGEIRASPAGELHIRTGEPGYYGLHHENALVTHEYRVEFRARVERYTRDGDTLGVSLNYGPQIFSLILRQDGAYVLRQNGRTSLLRAMPMDLGWHVWTVEVRSRVARIHCDGRLIGEEKVVGDQPIGNRPITVHVRTRDATDPAEVRIDYLKVANLPEEGTGR